LVGDFIIYEHPFDVPDGFLSDIEEIAQIAARTPFLLLIHPFAEHTFKTLEALAKTTPITSISATYYRARKDNGHILDALADFGPPPPEKVAEGRFNHAGHAMLYLALEADTAFGEVAAPGVQYFVASLRIETNLKVLNLSLKNEADSEDEILIQCLARSALCAAPRTGEGWVAREYVFTRFVADCARNAGFDAIGYGSTKGYGANLVILEPPRPLSGIAVLEHITQRSRVPDLGT
jgi:RES domain-containing protein